MALYSIEAATTATYDHDGDSCLRVGAGSLALDATRNGYVYVADAASNRIEFFNAATCNATITTGCTSPPATVLVGNDPVALVVAGRGARATSTSQMLEMGEESQW